MPRSRFCVSVPEVTDRFEIVRKIGRGAFSNVHLVRLKQCLSMQFALKRLNRTVHYERLEKEIRILRKLRGKKNIIRLMCAFRKDDQILLFMEYFPNDSFVSFCNTATIFEIRDYMKNLLIALRFIHERGIIHHDIKPSNFLFDRKQKRYALIDFGLAEDMAPPAFLPLPNKDQNIASVKGRRKLDFDTVKEKCAEESQEPIPRKSPRKAAGQSAITNTQSPFLSQKSQDSKINVLRTLSQPSPSPRSGCDCLGRCQYCKICVSKPLPKVNHAGTSGYRAPETLLNASSQYQTSAIDIWACGVILLSLLSRRYPFMKPKYGGEALAYIMALVGTHKMAIVAKLLGVKLNYDLPYAPLDLRELCSCFRLNGNFPASDRGGECSHCVPNFRQPLANADGKFFCLCRTSHTDHRGPLFEHFLKMELEKKGNSEGKETGDKAVLFDQAFDCLTSLLQPHPMYRPRAKDALSHHWFNS